jgi:hypothetical protein
MTLPRLRQNVAKLVIDESLSKSDHVEHQGVDSDHVRSGSRPRDHATQSHNTLQISRSSGGMRKRISLLVKEGSLLPFHILFLRRTRLRRFFSLSWEGILTAECGLRQSPAHFRSSASNPQFGDQTICRSNHLFHIKYRINHLVI